MSKDITLADFDRIAAHPDEFSRLRDVVPFLQIAIKTAKRASGHVQMGILAVEGDDGSATIIAQMEIERLVADLAVITGHTDPDVRSESPDLQMGGPSPDDAIIQMLMRAPQIHPDPDGPDRSIGQYPDGTWWWLDETGDYGDDVHHPTREHAMEAQRLYCEHVLG